MHKSLRLSERNKDLYKNYLISKGLENVNCTKGFVFGLLLQENIIKNVSNKDIMEAYNKLNLLNLSDNIANPTSLNLKTSTITDLDAWYSRCRMTIPNADLSLCIDIAFTIANNQKDIKTWNAQVSEMENTVMSDLNLWVLIEKITNLCKKATMGDEESIIILRNIQTLIAKNRG